MRFVPMVIASIYLALILAVAGCGHAQRGLLPMAERQEALGLFRMPPSAPGEQPTVYLTIDDGPSTHTDEMLELLGAYGATATFFVHTDHILTERDRAVLREAVANGHRLGNHLPADERADSLSPEAFLADLTRAQSELETIAGVRPVLFRPPHGAINAAAMSPALLAEGYIAADGSERRYVLASFIPWDAGGATETTLRAMNNAAGARYADGMSEALFDGAIVVFHDGPREVRTQTTLVSLRRFLKAADRKGFAVKALPQ
ncbi:polysaccharide deacetylase family protein [Parvularcula sp. ZS-1/3]|uniref:Chitooligosaccharide deacetylase n=1 Tax=Parvularcula mediterranea TaxID=2732508 RepID=A0A7Y3RPV6_9PROT|nr:polysaccharide deacetylase family protein [Parvularcula mediterranea]NNU17187.1 polysaccharide deacetylase family protein [Parvularcula mediterranea]